MNNNSEIDKCTEPVRGSSRRKPKVTRKVIEEIADDELTFNPALISISDNIDDNFNHISPSDTIIDTPEPVEVNHKTGELPIDDTTDIDSDIGHKDTSLILEPAIVSDEEFVIPEGTLIIEPESVTETDLIFKGPEFRGSRGNASGSTGGGGGGGGGTSSAQYTSSSSFPSTCHPTSTTGGSMTRVNMSDVQCTSCSRQLNTNDYSDVHRHPVLRVLVCKKCNASYDQQPIEKDADGMDEQCRWCHNGGNLICCDYCNCAFCKSCIKRNLGRSELSTLLDTDDNVKWSCYVCDPSPLCHLVSIGDSVFAAMDKHVNREREKEIRRIAKVAQQQSSHYTSQQVQSNQTLHGQPKSPLISKSSTQSPVSVVEPRQRSSSRSQTQAGSLARAANEAAIARAASLQNMATSTTSTTTSATTKSSASLGQEFSQKYKQIDQALRTSLDQDSERSMRMFCKWASQNLNEYNIKPVIERTMEKANSLFRLLHNMVGQLTNADMAARRDVVARFQQLMKAYQKSLNELPTFVDQLTLKMKQKDVSSRHNIKTSDTNKDGSRLVLVRMKDGNLVRMMVSSQKPTTTTTNTTTTTSASPTTRTATINNKIASRVHNETSSQRMASNITAQRLLLQQQQQQQQKLAQHLLLEQQRHHQVSSTKRTCTGKLVINKPAALTPTGKTFLKNMLKCDTVDIRGEMRRCTPTNNGNTELTSHQPVASSKSLLATAAGLATNATNAVKRTRLSAQKQPQTPTTSTRRSTSMLHRELTAPIATRAAKTSASPRSTTTQRQSRASFNGRPHSTRSPCNTSLSSGTPTSTGKSGTPVGGTIVKTLRQPSTRNRSSPANMPRTRSILLQQTDGTFDWEDDSLDESSLAPTSLPSHQLNTPHIHLAHLSLYPDNHQHLSKCNSLCEESICSLDYNCDSVDQLDGATGDSDIEDEDETNHKDVSFETLYSMVTEAATSFNQNTTSTSTHACNNTSPEQNSPVPLLRQTKADHLNKNLQDDNVQGTPSTNIKSHNGGKSSERSKLSKCDHQHKTKKIDIISPTGSHSPYISLKDSSKTGSSRKRISSDGNKLEPLQYTDNTDLCAKRLLKSTPDSDCTEDPTWGEDNNPEISISCQLSPLNECSEFNSDKTNAGTGRVTSLENLNTSVDSSNTRKPSCATKSHTSSSSNMDSPASTHGEDVLFKPRLTSVAAENHRLLQDILNDSLSSEDFSESSCDSSSYVSSLVKLGDHNRRQLNNILEFSDSSNHYNKSKIDCKSPDSDKHSSRNISPVNISHDALPSNCIATINQRRIGNLLADSATSCSNSCESSGFSGSDDDIVSSITRNNKDDVDKDKDSSDFDSIGDEQNDNAIKQILNNSILGKEKDNAIKEKTKKAKNSLKDTNPKNIRMRRSRNQFESLNMQQIDGSGNSSDQESEYNSDAEFEKSIKKYRKMPKLRIKRGKSSKLVVVSSSVDFSPKENTNSMINKKSDGDSDCSNSNKIEDNQECSDHSENKETNNDEYVISQVDDDNDKQTIVNHVLNYEMEDDAEIIEKAVEEEKEEEDEVVAEEGVQQDHENRNNGVDSLKTSNLQNEQESDSDGVIGQCDDDSPSDHDDDDDEDDHDSSGNGEDMSSSDNSFANINNQIVSDSDDDVSDNSLEESGSCSDDVSSRKNKAGTSSSSNFKKSRKKKSCLVFSDLSSDSDISLTKKTHRKKNKDQINSDLSDSGGKNTNKKSRKRKANSENNGKKKNNKKKKKKVFAPSDSDDIDFMENKKVKKRKRIKTINESDSDSDVQKEEEDKNGRKTIRKIIKDKGLDLTTVAAEKAEKERRKRIKDNQKLFNDVNEEVLDNLNGLKTTKLILEIDKDTKEPIVQVPECLCKVLKPHQVQAVKFMYDCCIESIERNKQHEGSGCILAHCMGLGKSLSVITFVQTLMNHGELTDIATCLIICPLNTVLNWENEFSKWLPEHEQFSVYHLSSIKNNNARVKLLEAWQDEGGIMICGYEMYRNLVQHRNIKSKRLKLALTKTLADPGPDIVICDEGHILKNAQTAMSKAVNQIRTRRRVILTGTPLQNNLIEYHCMVDFVKPKLLGSKKEFSNRFVNPITNGQCADSTYADVRIMKRRAHVLHEKLAGCVQRKDYSSLTKYLMPKHEYVLSIRMSEIQVKLYGEYLNRSSNCGGGAKLFSDYQMLMRIWTHPWILRLDEIRKLNKKALEDSDSMDDFLDDSVQEITSDSDIQIIEDKSDGEISIKSEGSENIKKWQTKSRRTRAGAKIPDSPPSLNHSATAPSDLTSLDPSRAPLSMAEWWAHHVPESMKFCMNVSGKIRLLASILKKCESIGDKILVFSQSLLSLDLIEDFLKHWDTEGDITKEGITGTQGWTQGADYFRMDGSTSGQIRQANVVQFNKEDNYRARLFLISTKAGSLGTNLVSANRVIIFDASWNPSHDVQSIFRVFRFGQLKPVYIYRFLAQGTMEEKIYERQVTKQSLAQRVVDEHQIDRHFNQHDLAELYRFTPDILDADGNCKERPTPQLPKDRLLAELLTEHKREIVTYHEHDSLLENKIDEELTEEERKTAWEEFDADKDLVRRNASQNNLQQMTSYQIAMQQHYIAQAHAQAQAREQATASQYNMNVRAEEIARAIYAANPNLGMEELQTKTIDYMNAQNNLTIQMQQRQMQVEQQVHNAMQMQLNQINQNNRK